MRTLNRATGTPERVPFKTNIMTPNDVAAVTLNLNGLEPVDSWNVDTDSR